jgi:hypothetical protein
MKKYVIKKPSTSNPSIWEWKTYQKEGTTWVGLVEYDNLAESETAKLEFGADAVVVELNKPDV